MIKLTDLDGVKLVDRTNFADDDEVLNSLEAAYMQGSQGWGVTKEVAIQLTLAECLRAALTIAATADDNRRMLKGAQMELGRVKKQRDTLQSAVDSLTKEVQSVRGDLENRQSILDEAEDKILDLQQ